MDHAYLVLENGKVFSGRSFGAKAEAAGEVVFTTSMTGYLETLTDPSYYGQIVVQTFPLMGNYGVIPDDFESNACHMKGYIVKHPCDTPSNFRSEGTLDAFLKEQGIPGIYGVDTRELTRILREVGVMNGIITDDPVNVDIDKLRAYTIGDAVAQVSRGDNIEQSPQAGYRVALWDFGAKDAIRRTLMRLGCEVTCFRSDTPAHALLADQPDGILLSNGPGDPAANRQVIHELPELVDSGIPIFGICLGHQLLAMSLGADTEKLKYGHRGANHPVRDTLTGRVLVTSQNHGYTVVPDTLPGFARVSYQNVNDGTVEGIEYTAFPGMSVQFHPEAAAGPLDTSFLFDKFIQMMEGAQHAAE